MPNNETTAQAPAWTEEDERDRMADRASEPHVWNKDGAYEKLDYLPGVGWRWVWTTPEREAQEQRESDEADYQAWRRS